MVATLYVSAFLFFVYGMWIVYASSAESIERFAAELVGKLMNSVYHDVCWLLPVNPYRA